MYGKLTVTLELNIDLNAIAQRLSQKIKYAVNLIVITGEQLRVIIFSIIGILFLTMNPNLLSALLTQV